MLFLIHLWDTDLICDFLCTYQGWEKQHFIIQAGVIFIVIIKHG